MKNVMKKNVAKKNNVVKNNVVKKKMLVIDDSVLMRTLIGAFLKEFKAYDIELRFASNGLEALEALSEDPQTDLISLDVNMPEMTGFEFLERLRVDPKLAEIPVIFISCETGEGDVAKGLAAGANTYLTKPLDGTRLREVIKQVFGTGGSADHRI